MQCPHCEQEGYVCILCWVAADGWDHGDVLECAGDGSDNSQEEPEQLAFCGDCWKYFQPPEGFAFRVVDKKPVLVEKK